MGVGRPVEVTHLRPGDRRILPFLRLKPWKARMRFGWILSWDGPYMRTAVGIAGSDWDGGNWLGGMVWRKHGPFVVCRARRRGSWRSDRRFARLMASFQADGDTEETR
jgi:hypothetical protein